MTVTGKIQKFMMREQSTAELGLEDGGSDEDGLNPAPADGPRPTSRDLPETPTPA